MVPDTTEPEFWAYLDGLVATCEIVIDRPRGSNHPRIPAAIYPLDYGYLAGTTAGDGDGIDIWLGTGRQHGVTGIVCTVDIVKRDAEVKILHSCSTHDMIVIQRFLNKGQMRAVVLPRPHRSPD